MCTVEPSWTTYLAALLTPTIAILASIVAYRQWRTAQNKLKLDLFDRRFSIYDAARKFISSIMTSGKVTGVAQQSFLSGTHAARWLLNEEVDNYLANELWGRAIDLETLDAELQGLPVGDERTKNVRKQSEIKTWMYAQYKVLDSKFEGYLRLKH